MNLRSRAFPIIGLGLSALLLVGAIISLSVGEKGPETFEARGVALTQQTYGGILQEGNRLGARDAEVTVSVFTDLQCPSCARWYERVIPRLVEREVRPGEVALELHHFSIGPIGRTRSAFAAVAAAEQGDEFQFVQLFMANIDQVPQQGVDDRYLELVAGRIPSERFEIDQWFEALDSERVEAIVDADAALAGELRLSADSAVVIDGANASLTLEGSPSLGDILAAIAEAR